MTKRIRFEGTEITSRTKGKPIVTDIDPDLAVGDYLETICSSIDVESEKYAIMKDGSVLCMEEGR